MSSVLSILTLLLAFLTILGALCMGGKTQARLDFSKAVPADMTVSEFLSLDKRRRKNSTRLLLQEKEVRSLGHRYVGRLDAVVVSWQDAPVLHVVLERKFPAAQLPSRPRPEDLFQLGLYALALLESGMSCRSTRLMVTYCLQDTASRCFKKSDTPKCSLCSEGRTFTKQFRQKEVLEALSRLDEVWYGNRAPKPKPSSEKCRRCPFGSSHLCIYSKV